MSILKVLYPRLWRGKDKGIDTSKEKAKTGMGLVLLPSFRYQYSYGTAAAGRALLNATLHVTLSVYSVPEQ